MAEDSKMTKAVKAYYLKRVKEYRLEGMDQYDAAEAAARDTKRKYGYIPGG